MSRPIPRVVPVTTLMMIDATRLAKGMGVINNSFLQGQGSVAGFLGELAVCKVLHCDRKSTKDYDLVLKNGQTVDVKSKQTTVPPLASYEASVAETSRHQQCDSYVFTRVLVENAIPKSVWIMGWISRQMFYMISRKLNSGDIDPSNGYSVRVACYNISYSELGDISELEVSDV